MIRSARPLALNSTARIATLLCLLTFCTGGAIAQSPNARLTLPPSALNDTVPEESTPPLSTPDSGDVKKSPPAPPDEAVDAKAAPAVEATTAPPAESAAAASVASVPAAAPATATVAQPTAAAPVTTAACLSYITADVVAFDQVYTYNRFGAFNPAGMMYALRRDVEAISGTELKPGNVQLRKDKRPRPIVLRVHEDECLRVTFQNLLTPKREHIEDKNFTNQPKKQPYTGLPTNYEGFPIKLRKNDSPFTRLASMHVNGLDYVVGPDVDDGANVGENLSSLAVPEGAKKTYTWYAAKQGQYLLFSMGTPTGGEGDNGQGGLGLFGSVNVEPKQSKWYRSQLTARELEAVTVGTNPNGTPIIKYDDLNILKGTEIVHTDLNAVITDVKEDCTLAPPSGTCGLNFREFTVIFHDEIKAVQAFSKANELTGDPESPLDAEVFHGVRDGFGINYGASGLGSIVIANRSRVGPAKECDDCKFEEFFLESWVNGDPAMVVKPDPVTGLGVEALFPDDPSNVHHSYLNDPVRFRNLHIGAETHVFHLHAHQWLQTPRYEDSTYLDSQTISPGGSYTYEINYGGSGNRNKTPGDAIFHCHLYPHFAQGMWELWRVHDVFEAGTPDRRLPDAELGTSPNPAIVPLPNLALPPMPDDNFRGYPFYIEAVAGKRPPQPPLDFDVDESGIIPNDRDGGLPRHIILDAKVQDGKAGIAPALLADEVAKRVLNDHDYSIDPPLGFTNESPLTAFARKLLLAEIKVLPSEGTDREQVAMSFHEGCYRPNGEPCDRFYPSFTATGKDAKFEVNGMKRQPGAPYADPCRPDEAGTPSREIEYRSAYIQFDVKKPMVVNKKGWHDRQARIMTLEQDAQPTLDGVRPPEPLFFRANSRDCIVFNATNLIPKDLNLDDFQIFTPTDIMGQHIHLVKFDVTSSDGAGNGWNYEDGTFSPGEVQERIHANNKYQEEIGGNQIFYLEENQAFGPGPDHDKNGIGDWVGAQTTVQRWWADPLLNNQKKDRTIRTVFTHDHFGPSSHQHHGFYGALVVEREKSVWTKLDGTQMFTRPDGGPTSFAANILDRDGDRRDDSFREFNLAFADFALVYRRDERGELRPINPPGRKKADLPIAIQGPEKPVPEAISADDPGTQLINYRHEPIPLRIGEQTSSGSFVQKSGPEGDMANVFSSRVHDDPFTPVLPAYEKDQTVVRLIQGAQEEQHVFNLHGYKWLFQPGTLQGSFSENNTGYRNGQQIGISEHFEFYLNQPPPNQPAPALSEFNKDTNPLLAGRFFSDHLYSSAATDNLWDGQWGILRVYANRQSVQGSHGVAQAARGDEKAPGEAAAETGDIVQVPDPEDPVGKKAITLARLPNNLGNEPAPTEADVTATKPAAPNAGGEAPSAAGAAALSPEPYHEPACTNPNREYKVSAFLARDILPGGEVVYNKKFGLVDPNAIMFVNEEDVEPLRNEAMQPEPLILRANADDCIAVHFTNRLPDVLPENDSWNMMPPIVEKFNFNQVKTSNRVGLHSQLVAVNTFLDDGAFVGFNPDSTVAPGQTHTYYWYAGDRYVPRGTNIPIFTPIEFGATGLRDMGDVIKHSSHGALGALIIEPQGSTWQNEGYSRATADVYNAAGKYQFREFVAIYQTDLSLQQRNGRLWDGLKPLRNIDDTDDPEDSGMKAFNYRTEPLWGRLGPPIDITTPPIGGPDHPGPSINDVDVSNVLSSHDPNPGCGGPCGDPETPLFIAKVGSAVRFRVLDVAGHPRQHGFTIFGHHWQFEPWEKNSTVQGFNPRTFEIGSESGIGPTRHVNILTQAGGLFSKPGDYLYRSQESFQFSYGGLWGLFRVVE